MTLFLELIYQRHGKGKLRLAILRADGDIFSVGAYDGFDDIQSQTPAVPVLGAGLVQLVEPVEDQGQLFRGDGVAIVGDGDIGLAAAFPDL